MTEYDTRFEKRLNVIYECPKDIIIGINEWNRLSLYYFDKGFDYHTNKVVDDKLLPHTEDVKPTSTSDNNYVNM